MNFNEVPTLLTFEQIKNQLDGLDVYVGILLLILIIGATSKFFVIKAIDAIFRPLGNVWRDFVRRL